MKNQYHHSNVKNILTAELGGILQLGRDIVSRASDMVTKYDSHIEANTVPTSKELYYDINTILTPLSKFYAYLTDVFMLRRFLDKDYITNAIVYSGAFHSENYIDILVNRFGFTITHVANKDESVDEIEKAVKEGKAFEIFKTMEQCSDLTSFPTHFL